jgi:hypothetical protein
MAARSQAELREAFAAALTRLPIRSGEEWRLPLAADWLLAVVAAMPKAHELPAFRRIGRKQAEREIAALRAAAEARDLPAARRAQAELHAPVIDALARAGFVRQRLCVKMLPKLAAAAKRARLGKVPRMQRRQRSAEDRFIAGLADMLAGFFFDLSGERPTLGVRYIAGSDSASRRGRPKRSSSATSATEPYGNFFRLVADTLKIMGIERSPIAAARGACAKFKAGEKAEPAADSITAADIATTPTKRFAHEMNRFHRIKYS